MQSNVERYAKCVFRRREDEDGECEVWGHAFQAWGQQVGSSGPSAQSAWHCLESAGAIWLAYREESGYEIRMTGLWSYAWVWGCTCKVVHTVVFSSTLRKFNLISVFTYCRKNGVYNLWFLWILQCPLISQFFKMWKNKGTCEVKIRPEIGKTY